MKTIVLAISLSLAAMSAGAQTSTSSSSTSASSGSTNAGNNQGITLNSSNSGTSTLRSAPPVGGQKRPHRGTFVMNEPRHEVEIHCKHVESVPRACACACVRACVRDCSNQCRDASIVCRIAPPVVLIV